MTTAEYNNCVENFSDNIYRFILKNLNHKDDAEDIVQNAYEILWKKHQEVSYKKAKSYLFRVAYNNMIDMLRKTKKIRYTDQIKENGRSAAVGFTGALDVIKLGLEKLPDDQRSVVMLRDYEGYSYAEIAEITGLSETQVKVYIFRARKTLQKYLVRIENIL